MTSKQRELVSKFAYLLDDSPESIFAWLDQGSAVSECRLAPTTLIDLYAHLDLKEALAPLLNWFRNKPIDEFLELISTDRYSPIHSELFSYLADIGETDPPLFKLLPKLNLDDLENKDLRFLVEKELDRMTKKELLTFLVEKKGLQESKRGVLRNEILYRLSKHLDDRDFYELVLRSLNAESIKELCRLQTLRTQGMDISLAWENARRKSLYMDLRPYDPYTKCKNAAEGCTVDEAAWKKVWCTGNPPFVYSSNDEKANLQTILRSFRCFLHENGKLVYRYYEDASSGWTTEFEIERPLDVTSWKLSSDKEGGASRKWITKKEVSRYERLVLRWNNTRWVMDTALNSK